LQKNFRSVLASPRRISRRRASICHTRYRDRVVSPHHHRRMRRKLSPKLIEHLKSPGPKRLDVWDTVLQCFGLRISPTGRKAWFVIVRLDGRQKRITIGTYPAVSLAEARTEARKIIRDAQLGVFNDSNRCSALTLGGTVPLFIQLYAKPKNRGWKESERLLEKFQRFSPSLSSTSRAVTLCVSWTKSLCLERRTAPTGHWPLSRNS
jgi:Arm DNA-binding domain